MKLIKLERRTGDKIEQINLIIKIYLLLKKIEITDNEKLILSYFCHYGINLNTEKLLYKCEIISSKFTYRNTLSKFKKLGFIEKNIRREYNICDEILMNIDDQVAMLIKIDNT